MPDQPVELEDESPLAPDLVREIRAAQAQLARAVLEAKLHDDPMRFLLIALSDMLGVLHRLFVDGSLALTQTIHDAQRPATLLSPDAERAHLDRLGKGADQAMRIAAPNYIRARLWRDTLIAGVVGGAITLTAVGGGYWWGHRSARAEIADTEAGLRAAFAAGPAEAALWLRRMELNPFKLPCHEHVENGRRVCDTALWMDPPRN